MSRRLTIAAFAAAMIAGAAAAQDDAVTAGSVVATVNGTEITLGDVIVAKSRLPQQFQSMEDSLLFPGLVDQLIQQTLLAQSAGDLNQANAILLAAEERAVRSAQAIAEVLKAGITDAAIQAAYDAAYGDAGGTPEYNASHILVETEDEAKALIADLDGGADFAELARAKSTGPSGPNGGSLGWFGPGRMVPAFEEAVVALEVGAISPPVQTQFGWHVVKLNETRVSAAPPLAQVRAEVEGQVQQQLVEGRLQELSADAAIERADLEAFDPAVINDLSIIGQ